MPADKRDPRPVTLEASSSGALPSSIPASGAPVAGTQKPQTAHGRSLAASSQNIATQTAHASQASPQHRQTPQTTGSSPTSLNPASSPGKKRKVGDITTPGLLKQPVDVEQWPQLSSPQMARKPAQGAAAGDSVIVLSSPETSPEPEARQTGPPALRLTAAGKPDPRRGCGALYGTGQQGNLGFGARNFGLPPTVPARTVKDVFMEGFLDGPVTQSPASRLSTEQTNGRNIAPASPGAATRNPEAAPNFAAASRDPRTAPTTIPRTPLSSPDSDAARTPRRQVIPSHSGSGSAGSHPWGGSSQEGAFITPSLSQIAKLDAASNGMGSFGISSPELTIRSTLVSCAQMPCTPAIVIAL